MVVRMMVVVVVGRHVTTVVVMIGCPKVTLRCHHVPVIDATVGQQPGRFRGRGGGRQKAPIIRVGHQEVRRID